MTIRRKMNGSIRSYNDHFLLPPLIALDSYYLLVIRLLFGREGNTKCTEYLLVSVIDFLVIAPKACGKATPLETLPGFICDLEFEICDLLPIIGLLN
jgi:hypothetical protein